MVVIDLLKPHLARGRSDQFYLKAARVVVGAAIVLMTLGAFSFSRMEKESMNDVSLIVFSVLGGAITGLYMIGFFTRRVDGKSANIALGVAVAFNIYLGFGLLGWLPQGWKIGVHSYWVGAIVNVLFAVLAYCISLWRRVPPQKLDGLTVWTMKSKMSPVADNPHELAR